MYQEYGFTFPEQLEAAVDTAYQEMRQTSGELKALETKLQGKMIATITRQQVGTVERALQIFMKLGLVEPLQNGALYMSNIELLIGQSSTKGERKRHPQAGH